jgi:heterodisulfide reductase subunit A-like polyferredoxin
MSLHETPGKKVGAALIVGGGIGGMQAALDLAACGIKVYLADSKPSIGGVMSQLDKTFPTNDCAMCMQAPRLVEIGRHKDIEILTLSDVESVKGAPGDFHVTLKKRPRYVDITKCTGCGLCFPGCPVVMKNEFDLGLSERKAIYTLFPQAVPNKAAIDKREERPCKAACMDRCPIHTNVLGYVKLIAEGKFQEAYQMNRNINPLPSVCGRVCYAPCEQACNRGQLEDPIAIRQLKRFVADRVTIDELPVPQITRTDKRVGVIGAGPAGLAAAHDLALEGHQVTIFEAQPEPGGMLRYAIPEYRLPKETLRKEIDYIQRLGVEIKTDIRVGKDLALDDLREYYQAVFIGIGAQKGMPLEVEGGDLPGVTDGIRFLQSVNLGEKVHIGEKVAVIGGGNTAIECARTARRLGAKEVRIVYRRSRTEMPATEEEITAAEREGVKIDYLTLPKRFLSKDGHLSAMECIGMTLGDPDASGPRRGTPVPNSDTTLSVDTVISALGQVTQADFLKEVGISLTQNGMIVIDPKTGATNVGGIFAGGDVVTGAAYVIDAIAAGKRAARSINRYLKGEPIEIPEEEKQPAKLSEKEVAALKVRFPSQKRIGTGELPADKRVNSFQEVALGFTPQEAVAEAMRCLAGQIEGCIECGECKRRCEAKAIDYGEKEETLEINVGAIILSPGYELFDARIKKEWGYGRFPNVVSALEFERILSASGPYSGHVQRPFDKKTPRRIAFLQCVGSRDSERDYCSSICCMYATKEAIIAKEHAGEDLTCDIFFMDMRAFGKGFEEYYERAKQLGVDYIRCRPASIEEVPETRNLIIKYLVENEKKVSREYDLVVLSSGVQPPKQVDQLSKTFGIDLNEYRFCKTSTFRPVESNREGIYVAGPFAEPKDIPETVMEASGAASKVLSLLMDVRGSLIVQKEFPPERDVTAENPKIGVFVCHCGSNIGGFVNVPDVVEYAKTLPHVVYAENNLYTCSNDTQEKIKEKIKEHQLNRVVVASCTPRTHEPLFRNTIRGAGLNSYLFEMANIRDQCSWVHMHEIEKATVKSKDLVRMAIAKARLLEPLQTRSLLITKSALVIGAGISGMTSALGLANQGFDVYLVEREKEMGGHVWDIHYLIDGSRLREEFRSLIKQVKEDARIHVLTQAKIETIEGSIGHFKTKVSMNGTSKEIEHGTVIVATGAKEYHPNEYLYGEDERVITQLELERRLVVIDDFISSPGKGPGTVVMIQCVGSRDEERPYCSRLCCTEAVKNALKIKELSPVSNVYVLYRDIRTYGFKERFYTKARQQGVVFIRYDKDEKPSVSRNGKGLKVRVHDQTLGLPVEIPADLIVLSAGIVPNEDNKTLAQFLKIPLNKDGFFLEAHMKLRPVDFATDGVFLAGMAHFPKAIEESIVQAQAASARAATVLSRESIELEGNISQVVDENCDGCAYCVDTCPYKAITLFEYVRGDTIKKTVEANETVCKGCGCCMATCPKQGIFVRGFKLEQIAAQVDAALGVSS